MSTAMVWCECTACGVMFGVPRTIVELRLQNGRAIFCPSGDPNGVVLNEQPHFEEERAA